MQNHIKCTKSQYSRIVLMPGDPARAEYIAKKFLSYSKKLSSYREFITYVGFYKGVKIAVTSTGIGSPSTSIAVEEAINLGANIIIRVGTCGGSLKKEIKVGSIIIPTASIREEGTTREYMPAEFPAVADVDVVQALKVAALNLKYNYFVGINRTHDAFYGKSQNLKKWGEIYLNKRMREWYFPLISSEMECAPLFLIGTLRGIKTGAVLAVNANPEPLKDMILNKLRFDVPKSKIYTNEAKLSVDRTIQTALDASIILSKML